MGLWAEGGGGGGGGSHIKRSLLILLDGGVENYNYFSIRFTANVKVKKKEHEFQVEVINKMTKLCKKRKGEKKKSIKGNKKVQKE